MDEINWKLCFTQGLLVLLARLAHSQQLLLFYSIFVIVFASSQLCYWKECFGFSISIEMWGIRGLVRLYDN